MNIKENSFIENVIIAAAFSRLDSQSNNNKSSFKELESKIYNLIDAIFSKFSSAYQKNKAKISNKIMIDLEKQKFEHISRATENVFSSKENKKVQQQQVHEKKLAQESLKESLTDKDAAALSIATHDQRKENFHEIPDFLKNMDVEHLLDTQNEIEEKAHAYQEMIDFLKNMDVGHLFESTDEIEEKALIYHEIISERQSEENMLAFNKYLIENPGALAGFLLFLQVYATRDIEES